MMDKQQELDKIQKHIDTFTFRMKQIKRKGKSKSKKARIRRSQRLLMLSMVRAASLVQSYVVMSQPMPMPKYERGSKELSNG